MIDFELISQLADAGVHFINTTPGMSRSDVGEWQNRATTDKVVIKQWLDQGFSLVVVATPDGSFAFDIDNPDACVAKGFAPSWLDGYFRVKTPSGGYHFYGIQDATTACLPGIIKVKKDAELILELKLSRQSVAAPGAERKGQKGVDGIYRPSTFKGIRKGICSELLAWLKDHSEQQDQNFQSIPVVFADDWDVEGFLTHHHAEMRAEGMVGDCWHVAIVACPICGKQSDSTLAAAKAKFIFGGQGWGYKCHGCDLSSREELEEKLREEYPDFLPYSGPIYTDILDSALLDDVDDTVPAAELVAAMEVIAEEFAGANAENKKKWSHAADVMDELRKGEETYTVDGKEKIKKLPGHIVDENILRHTVNTLKKELGAKFFVDESPYIFLPGENTLWKFLDSDANKLLSRLRLRKVQRHTDFVDENLRLHILTYGEQTHVHKFGCRKPNAIYVLNGRGGMFKITVNAIEEVRNGTDGVYMKNKHMTPWPQYSPTDFAGMQQQLGGIGGKLTDSKLSEYFRAYWEEDALSASQYEQMVMFSYLALFLAGVSDLRPIRLATGPQNSGKSTLWEKHMWLFYGATFMSGGLPSQMRSLMAAVSNHEVQLFDNVDRTNFSDKDHAEYLDVMCKCATGGKLSLALLYQNNVDKEYNLRCNLFLTSRTNPFPAHASDVLRRTLTFPFRTPTEEEHKTTETLKTEFEENVSLLKLETLVRLQNILAALIANRVEYKPISEMASFEIFTRRVANYEHWNVEEIWAGLMGNYKRQLTEGDPFVGWIKCWLGKSSNAERTMRPGGIYADLERDYGRSFTKTPLCSNAAAFGKGIRKNFEALKSLGIAQIGNNGGPTYSFVPTPLVREECEACYAETRSLNLSERTNEVLDRMSKE